MSLANDYKQDGFVVIDTEIPVATLVAAREATGPLQPKQYHWNSSGRRTFEGWKSSQAVRDCVYAPKVVEALKDIFDLKEPPRPVQTINFDKPSLQKVHADAVHFDTWPVRGRMVGVWLALEDVDESNGTLAYVPGSHLMPPCDWNAEGFPRCRVDAQYPYYAEYENRMERIADKLYGGKVPFRAKMGQAFAWGLNMLHGGWPTKDPLRTRYSMVTHYALPDPGMRLWAPMFSDTRLGEEGIYFKKSRWFDREGNLHAL